MKKLLFLPILFFGLSLIGQAGYQPGDKVNNFSLMNVDGKMVTMNASDSDIEGYILIFTCNHCPYSVLYEDRIIELDKKFKGQGYPVLAINPNDPKQYEDDSFEHMKVRADEKGFTFPYLVDETQSVASAFGATRTPHVFLVQKVGSDFVLQYMGAIDDSARDEEAIEELYVENAINALKNGQKIKENSTKAIGCSIKWKK
jgi:peroxiredoxin